MNIKLHSGRLWRVGFCRGAFHGLARSGVGAAPSDVAPLILSLGRHLAGSLASWLPNWTAGWLPGFSAGRLAHWLAVKRVGLGTWPIEFLPPAESLEKDKKTDFMSLLFTCFSHFQHSKSIKNTRC